MGRVWYAIEYRWVYTGLNMTSRDTSPTRVSAANVWLWLLCLLTPLWCTAAVGVGMHRLLLEPDRQAWINLHLMIMEAAATLGYVVAIGAAAVGTVYACRQGPAGVRVAGLLTGCGCAALMYAEFTWHIEPCTPVIPLALIGVTALLTPLPWRARWHDRTLIVTATGGARVGRMAQIACLVAPSVVLACEVYLCVLVVFNYNVPALLLIIPAQVALAWLVVAAAPWLHLAPPHRRLALRHAQGWLIAVVLMYYAAFLFMVWGYFDARARVLSGGGEPSSPDLNVPALPLAGALTAGLLFLLLLVILWHRATTRAREPQLANAPSGDNA